MTTPRGIRNNNPLNIEAGDPWVGLADLWQRTPEQMDETRFAVFESAEYGIRAAAILLRKYQTKYGLNTVAEIIGRWAPSSENDVDSYAEQVARAMRVSPHAEVNLNDRETLQDMIVAMIAHENGSMPYSDAVIYAGIDRASGIAPIVDPTEVVTPEAAPIVESKPTFVRPDEPVEKPMPIPGVAISVLASVVPKLLELLPWFSSGSANSERNIKTIQALTPIVIDIAKGASGAAGALEASEAVLTNPEVQAKFKALMAEKWTDIQPMMEFEEESRNKARDFADTMTQGTDWRAVGFGFLIAVLAFLIIGGGGYVLYEVLRDPATPPEQKGMILGAIIAMVTTVGAYFFGSSAGSKRAGDAVRAIAEKK